MIPAKNIFSGSLGKIEKIGGSRFMTTPHTVLLNEASYTLELPVSGDFICCTLNGKLYLYKAEANYIIEALKWNDETGQLEHAATETLSIDESILARGIDWILTSYSIIQVINEEPYIITADLISRQGSSGIGKKTKFCYSLLRSQFFNEAVDENSTILGSGRDPFTLAAYGVDGTGNGNTEGWGYFSTNLGGVGLYLNDARIMESCYSSLPSVGDWNIIEDFLVRRPENPINATEDNYHFFMKQVRPLIPLEFNLYDDTTSYPSYGIGYSTERRGIQLASFNSEIWGRGLMHAGRVYILPAAFGDNGEPQEFYLYIGADIGIGSYNQITNPNLDESDEWLSVGVAALKDINNGNDTESGNNENNDTESYNNESNTLGVGFLSQKLNPLNCGVCNIAISDKVLFNGEWISLRQGDAGTAAFDNMNGAGIILGKMGASFIEFDKQNDKISTNDYECRELSQWLSPAGIMESIDEQICMSSCDNGLLATNISTKFNRFLLKNIMLPLAWGIFDKKDAETGNIVSRVKFSVRGSSEATGNIAINNIAYSNNAIAPVENIPWESIYKQAADIRVLNIKTVSFDRMIDGLPVLITSTQQDRHYGRMGYGTVTKSEYNKQGGGVNGHEYYSWSLKDTYNLFFVNPDTGDFESGNIEIDLTEYYTVPDEPMYPMWHRDEGTDGQGRWILLDTYHGISLKDIVTYVETYPVWIQERGWCVLIKKYKNYFFGWGDMNYSGGKATYSTELILVPIAAANISYNFPECAADITDWYSWEYSPIYTSPGDTVISYDFNDNNYSKSPCLDIISRFFFAPDIVSKEITQGNMTFADNMICDPYLAFTENSTKTKFLLRSSLFGGWTTAGKLKGIAKDIYNSNNQNWIFNAQPLSIYKYCISPITNYKGETRYEKALYLIILEKNYGWSSNQCIVIRADVNSEIFDFNSELIKSKIQVAQKGDEEDDEN